MPSWSLLFLWRVAVCVFPAPEGKIIGLCIWATHLGWCAQSFPLSVFPLCACATRKVGGSGGDVVMESTEWGAAGYCSGVEWFQPINQALFVVSGFYGCIDVMEKRGGDTKVCCAYRIHTVSAEQRSREQSLFSCFSVTIVLFYCHRERGLMNLQSPFRFARPCID